MPKQTFVANTSGGAWVTVVSGECTVASLVANSTASATLVGLRLRLANGNTAPILPMNTLPLSVPSRVAIAGLSLGPGDRLEAMSTDAVDWVATAITGTAYRSFVATSPATNAWTTLATGPGTVRGVFAASAGGSNVGIRLHKTAQDAYLALNEELTPGASKRIMAPTVLAAGETLQVQGTGITYWSATGVSA